METDMEHLLRVYEEAKARGYNNPMNYIPFEDAYLSFDIEGAYAKGYDAGYARGEEDYANSHD